MCPFCLSYRQKTLSEDSPERYYVFCTSCGARGPAVRCIPGEEEKAKKEAERLWEYPLILYDSNKINIT